MVEEMLDDLLAAHLCDHFGEDILAGSAEEGYGAPKAGSLLVIRLLIGRTLSADKIASVATSVASH